MKKKRKKNDFLDNEKFSGKFSQEVNSLILIFIGLFLSYSLKKDSMGQVGYFIKVMFLGFFSQLSIFIPYIIILIGLSHFIHIDLFKKIKENKFIYHVLFLIMLFYGLFNREFIPTDESPFMPRNLKIIFSMALEGNGSGIFSTILTYYFVKLFGVTGSYIVAIFLCIILVILNFNLSVKDLGGTGKVYFKSAFKNAKSFVKDFVMVDDAENSDKKKKSILKRKKIKKENNKENDDIPKNDTYKSEDTISFKNEDTIKIIDSNELKSKICELKQDTKIKKDAKNINNNIIKNEEAATHEYNTNIRGNFILHDENKFLNYIKPNASLLDKLKHNMDYKDKKEILKNAKTLEKTLKDFGVEASILQVTKGPTITRYEVQPKAGVKVSKIVNLVDDIALSLAAKSIRIEAPIPGKSAVGIEVPNEEVEIVSFREVIESDKFNKSKSKVSFGLGKDISGASVITDISKMPHLLVAGSTGSGKSVCINTLINSILYKANPDEVKFLMIDPKVVELTNYNGIPHLLIPVVTDAKKASMALNWAVNEMTRRYNLFAESSVRDITGYNNKHDEKLPTIVIIIDELADLMMVSPHEVEDAICRLSQMARAAGMHLVVATQRPSVDVITGVIKANIPSRIAFAVSSQIDSRTILDMSGAEKLLGKGDMLFYPVGSSKPIRLQGAFISDKEVESIVSFVKGQFEEPIYSNEIIENINKNISIDDSNEDEILKDAIDYVISSKQASASMLQRKFRIGYNRAARIIDDMEDRGIIGQSEGSKPRKVLISKEEYYSSVGE